MTTAASEAKAFKHRSREQQRGMASVEAIPLLIIFVMLSAYCVGIFGSIHTGILHSIAARTYAFEIFRNRANLDVHRENLPEVLMMNKSEIRFHGISDEAAPRGSDQWLVARRPLSVGYPSPDVGANRNDHLQRIFSLQPRNQAVSVGPIWIMIGYGMCLNASCGEQ